MGNRRGGSQRGEVGSCGRRWVAVGGGGRSEGEMG